jgi:hypothetical protein
MLMAHDALGAHARDELDCRHLPHVRAGRLLRRRCSPLEVGADPGGDPSTATSYGRGHPDCLATPATPPRLWRIARPCHARRLWSALAMATAGAGAVRCKGMIPETIGSQDDHRRTL